MPPTNLYKVECVVENLPEPLIELVRARTFKEAVQVVRDYVLEFDEPLEARSFTAQLLREPEEVGICYEPSGADEQFVLKNGFLTKPGWSPLRRRGPRHT